MENFLGTCIKDKEVPDQWISDKGFYVECVSSEKVVFPLVNGFPIVTETGQLVFVWGWS